MTGRTLIVAFCVAAAVVVTSPGLVESAEAIVEVSAGQLDRNSTPVRVALPESLSSKGQLQLSRLETGAPISVQQIETGSGTEAIWLIDERLPAGTSRRYRLSSQSVVDRSEAAVICRDNGKSLTISVDGRPVLEYNHAVVQSPQPEEPYYARSGYLHPVRTPGGLVVTDDFAPDHPHQHGIMFAWTNTSFEGRNINFWDQKAGTTHVRHKQVESSFDGPVCGGFSAKIIHSDLRAPGGARSVLSETWRVCVYRLADHFLFDLQSNQRVVGSAPLIINEYHYGGFAVRGPREWLEPGSCDFLTSEGLTRSDGNHSRPRWCDLTGTTAGRTGGITFLSHPDNFRSPQPVRLHPSKPYFSWSPMVLGGFEIRSGEDYVSRYRMLVHDGSVDRDAAEHLWRDYAVPPEAKVVSAKP